MSTLVGRLSAAGLLDRARGETDGRSVRLRPTEAAARRIASWRDVRAEVGARALDRLSAADRETLARAVPALARFAAALEEDTDAKNSGGGAAAQPDADGGAAG